MTKTRRNKAIETFREAVKNDRNQPTAAEIRRWHTLFKRVNADSPRSERVALIPENVEYYATQLWNLTNEGDVSKTRCRRIAEAICVGGR